MTKQNRDRVKSKLNEFELYIRLFKLLEKFEDHISRLKIVDYHCTNESDIRICKRSLKKAEYAQSCVEEAMEFLDLHGFLYLSFIDRLVEAIDKFKEDYKISRKRCLEILIENGEEVDFEIPKDLRN